jgi:biopolymer transport protein ExbD
MAMSLSADRGPLDEINMTPLIDVMLVLLVMFIITIPIQTHAVRIDLPQDCATCPKPDASFNKIVITSDDRILWNGQAISMQDLAPTLAAMTAMSPQPELQMQPEPEARWALVDEVLAVTKRAHVARMGFVGNEAFRAF